MEHSAGDHLVRGRIIEKKIQMIVELLRTTYRLLPKTAQEQLKWLKRPRFHLMRLLIRVLTLERVASGPFQGMHFAWNSYHDLACLLGTYELELRPVLESLQHFHFDTIVNVGAGSGYYAIGFGLKHPDAMIVSFEADDLTRNSLVRNVYVNGLQERAKTLGVCDTTLLGDELKD